MSARIREQVHALVDSLDARQLLAIRLYIEEIVSSKPAKPRRPTSVRDTPEPR